MAPSTPSPAAPDRRNPSTATLKWILGLGFWVQGFRCFPWMAINFFLKDGLHVDPSALQILQNSANIPMVGKPVYGLFSDAVYISGEHRLPYVAIGALLQTVSWLAVAFFSSSGVSIYTLTFYLLLSNLGASIAEVANDAIVAEVGKQPRQTGDNARPSSSSGELQSFVWMVSSVGGAIGNLLGGITMEHFTSRQMFIVFGVILAVQFLLTIMVRESSLNLPKSSSTGGMRKQLSELTSALRRPEIAYSIAWLAISYAMIPVLTGTMFFYQTEFLGIDSAVLGVSKVFGQAAMILWGVIYNRHLKSVSPRKLISAIQVTMAVLMASDVLFVKGFYSDMGLPNSAYVVIFSGLLEVLFFFKILPFSVLIAQLCPSGCEGSVMAFVMSAIALSFIVSGYLGVALASYVGVTGSDFSGLPCGLFIQAVCTLVPLFWSSWIPDRVKAKSRKEE